MPLYKVGVAGPVVLNSGRTVTDEETFDLWIEEGNRHDQDLEDRGIIIKCADQTGAAPKPEEQEPVDSGDEKPNVTDPTEPAGQAKEGDK